MQTAGKCVDLASALLSAGLAKLHSSFRPAEQPGGAELEAIERKAMEGRLKACFTLLSYAFIVPSHLLNMYSFAALLQGAMQRSTPQVCEGR